MKSYLQNQLLSSLDEKALNELFAPYKGKDYQIRNARLTDLEQLRILEKACWGSGLRLSKSKIQDRILRFSDGVWVLEQDEAVRGVIYSQRIKSFEALKTATIKTVGKLHDPEGEIMQLLSVNILPEFQSRGYGDELVEFVLQLGTALSNIQKVYAISCCRGFKGNTQEEYEKYIKETDSFGFVLDPILRFHQVHGAKIEQAVKGYRPKDKGNLTNGVLVSYDLATRKRFEGVEPEKIEKKKFWNIEEVSQKIEEEVKGMLGHPEDYGRIYPLMEMGLDSSDLMGLSFFIKRNFEIVVKTSFFFVYNTTEALIEEICNRLESDNKSRSFATAQNDNSSLKRDFLRQPPPPREIRDKDIAIISYSFRTPAGNSPEALWEVLSNEKNVIRSKPEERWSWPAWVDITSTHKGIDQGGYIEDIDSFDAAFFRISPREAELMDPQQRILLELTWELLEKAGYKPSSLKGSKTAVYIGASGSDYELALKENASAANYTNTGTSMAILPNRISYFYDFEGPSLLIDTACSSSLVAIHEAIKALRNGECEQAIVGGIHLMCHPNRSIAYHQSKMLSQTGHCYTFDQRANGYVRGEGAILTLLKPLSKAIEDGDEILGTIIGTAVNHGGQSGGLTVPNPDKQQKLLETAYLDAEIDIQSVSYIEAHGTGTPLGDPIEINGLTTAFENLKSSGNILKKPWCGLGSIKTNIGHLEAAAGFAGLIKVLLAMQHQQIPATINYESLNPEIDLTKTPFYINKDKTIWKHIEGMPLRAGISSFGIGGANGHVIVESFEMPKEKDSIKIASLIFPLSAKNSERLKAYAENILSYLTQYPNSDPQRLAWSFQMGREEMDERLGIVYTDIEDLKQQLKHFIAGGNGEYFTGNSHKNRKKLDHLIDILGLIEDQDLKRIAQNWCLGLSVNWKKLYPNTLRFLNDLPTYPFAKKRFWLPIDEQLMNEEEKSAVSSVSPINTVENVGTENAKYHVIQKIKELAGGILKLTANEFENDIAFGDYGFDSISLSELMLDLNDEYDIELKPTVFYEYPTIENLAEHLNESYSENVSSVHRDQLVQKVAEKPLTQKKIQSIPVANQKTFASNLQRKLKQVEEEQVAIIGMSGRFPGSPNLEAFWENLKANKDLVTEVPEERWDWKEYYGDPSKDRKKTWAKWGGFLTDLDKFDPLFFGISPREAELMDPQHRIALECAYHALEDAGQAPDHLRGSDTGVFIGIIRSEYGVLIEQNEEYFTKAQFATGNSYSILANRISYLFDFHGPSEPVLTACSSSLIAIHRAAEHIKSGRCKLALAGGVNAILKPEFSLSLSQAGMLSPDGRCKTFDESGNGYVRSEGIGMVVLKSLSEAIKDGDQIYGIIRGSAENHGGKANTLTSPNPNAQKELLIQAYQQAGIDPRNVSYIEAHGTGTKLGDPIEVRGLKLAFEELYKNYEISSAPESHIGLGSVKANVGHLEPAAGVAGVIKVLLALKNGYLPGNPHLKTANSFLNFEGSPFYLRKETTPWTQKGKLPRVAGVSSFGFGGANAHLILEEFISQKDGAAQSNQAYLIPFSAKNEDRLADLVKSFEAFLSKNQHLSIRDLAYTLQLGRNVLEARLAIVAVDIPDLIKQLQKYIEGNREGLSIGNIKKNNNQFLLEGGAGKAYIQYALEHKELKSLARLWAKGVDFDWQLLYQDRHPQKISLPTYPFARESYWISKKATPENTFSSNPQLHPLVHENISDLKEQKFQSRFDGNEAFLEDHQVQHEKILPGVAYIEMAREAGSRSLGQKITQINGISWLTPFRVQQEAKSLTTSLFLAKDELNVEMYDDEEIVYCQGKLGYSPLETPQRFNIESLQITFTSQRTGKEFYHFFNRLGFQYGKSFQGVQEIYFNQQEALAKLSLKKLEDTVLSPGIMDSALQVSVGIGMDQSNKNIELPFNIRSIQIHVDELPENLWCYARKNGQESSYDLDLLAEDGTAVVKIQAFTTLPLTRAKQEGQLHIHVPVWENVELNRGLEEVDEYIVLLAGGDAALADRMKDRLTQEVLAIQGEDEEEIIIELFHAIKAKLNQSLPLNVLVMFQHQEYQDYAFLSGLIKTTSIEHANFQGKTVSVNSLSVSSLEELCEIVEEEVTQLEDEVRYLAGKRQVKYWQNSPQSLTQYKQNTEIKDDGIYIITGGSGGLGLLFASFISSKLKHGKIILVGRRELTGARKNTIEQIPNCIYTRCDISNKSAVESLVDGVRQEYGKINGIIHSAGVLRDSLIVKKREDEIRDVLKPKISGAQNLDWATSKDELDFVVYFSSIASVFGNLGQADYASANSYLDHFAIYRNELAKSGKRKGKTISINWPLWREGGMQVDENTEELMKKQFGISPLPSQEGLHAFEQILASDHQQALVSFGNGAQLDKKLSQTQTVKTSLPKIEIDETGIKEELQKSLLQLAGEVLMLDPDNLSSDEALSDYGFDSILFTSFANNLNATYDLELMPTVFYNYPSLEELATFLLKAHIDQLVKVHHSTSINVKEKIKEVAPSPLVVSKKRSRSRFFNLPPQEVKQKITASQSSSTPIAIVGMSGKFPGSKDIDTFWENLKNNKDLISEVPADRWNWETYYGDPLEEAGKTKAKWGGFIEDMDKFDPLFFQISPKEAELMDPQQRISLEAVYHALEDAGILPEKIRGSNTGVFMGVSTNDYATLVGKQSPRANQAQFATGSTHSIVANRISYIFDLHGPSVPINTACSSSLVAIHRAIEQIQLGNCEMAIAGGVNAIISPQLTLAFSQAGMLSEDGRCKTFDANANGYVRAEGVGVIILKPLSQAEKDGDSIYGVIRGSAENHGGKANTLTAPNPNAQRDLLIKAYQRAGINPKDVTYIEAHGTGTKLGDPIEVEALKLAFRELYDQWDLPQANAPHCALGSVKTNIGHLETAAGIAGLLKILLAMKHEVLPGNPMLNTPNEFLKLEDSPFCLQKETTSWEANNKIAGISSFGFGGANAHIIIEEYKQPTTSSTYESSQPIILPLSAKNEAQLKELALHTAEYLRQHKASNIYDLAYSWQLHRTPLGERLAIIAKDRDAALEQLEAFLDDKKGTFFRGNAKHKLQHFILDGPAGKAYLKEALANKQENAIAQLWVNGADVNWNVYYPNEKPSRIPLPLYPFARERYWIPSPNHQTPIVNSILKQFKAEEIREVEQKEIVVSPDKRFEEKAADFITGIILSELRLPKEKVSSETPFEDLGIDSIVNKQLISLLGKSFESLSKTLFFEVRTLGELHDYLLERYHAKLKVLVSEKSEPGSLPESPSISNIPRNANGQQTQGLLIQKNTYSISDEPIAIIGLSGQYPGAKNIDEFWQLLKMGVDAIEKIPSERWDRDKYFDPKSGKVGKTNSKWGGFLKDVDKFDPLFFKISPHEAEAMDPQERLFLQSAWTLFEDAGYTREKLQAKFRVSDQSGLGANVGVFVGASYHEYALMADRANLKKEERSFLNLSSSIANRVSYFFNFNGPSIALDTMCSSSLSAIHLACSSLRQGDCRMAIAGGVNLNLDPIKYLALSDSNFLSPRGRCESFGEKGSGYVPSEGVGAVLLKPLSQAEADGDQIYGVIKASTVNHGGKTNGFTVPNPQAQALAIKQTMEKANLTAEDISYIEAHGTGTSLGDPVEINGLSRAFSIDKKQFCKIGSVKSNIGHCEAAAGVSGLTKILLQFRHKKLVPSIHSASLNPLIDFANSPFDVQQRLQDWQVPTNQKRIAGLSSFGAGGSNAHLLIEEYVPKQKPQYESSEVVIIPLSAKNKARLKETAKNLYNFLIANPNTNLQDLAYTLQEGREAMEERLVMVVADMKSLIDRLANFLNEIPDAFYTGNVKKDEKELSTILEASGGSLQAMIGRKDWDSLSEAWGKGGKVNWNDLYGSTIPRIISLPTYPFAKIRCWFTSTERLMEISIEEAKHPLIHENNSSPDQHKFKSTFYGHEKFLKDHQVNGKPILPGVAYLEMVREAVSIITQKRITRFSKVSWMQPILVEKNPKDIETQLSIHNGGIFYQILSSNGTLHGRGIAHTDALTQSAGLNLAEIQSRLHNTEEGARCYQIFREIGFDYGPSFRGIQKIYYNNQEALVRIQLPLEKGMKLSPGSMDAALQSCIAFVLDSSEAKVEVPFSVAEISIFDAPKENMWGYIRKAREKGAYHITLVDDNGKHLVAFKNFITLPYKKHEEPKEETEGLVLFENNWFEVESVASNVSFEGEKLVFLLDGSVDLADKLKEILEVEVLIPDGESEEEIFLYLFNIIKEALQHRKSLHITAVMRNEDWQYYGFLAGLFRTAQLESTRFKGKVIGVDQLAIPNIEELCTHIESEWENDELEVRFVNDKREVKTNQLIDEKELTDHPEIHFRNNGLYVITGGMGGLGLVFARHISQIAREAKILLIGRSKLNEERKTILETLPNCEYLSCDISNAEATERLFQTISKEYGPIHGIIHSAGVIRDKFILRKQEEEIRQVLAPKILGTKNIDFYTQEDALDFMIYFSSIAGVLGNVGQADYSAGNIFLDNYASYRNKLVKEGKRQGVTLSINWPLWKDGGMHIDAESEKRIKKIWGLMPMPTDAGVSAMDFLLKTNLNQGMVMYGDKAKIKSVIKSAQSVKKIEPLKQDVPSNPTISEPSEENGKKNSELLIAKLKEIFSKQLKIDAELLEADADFSDYGVDSILMMKLLDEIESAFDTVIEPTAILNYPSLEELSQYLEEEKAVKLETLSSEAPEINIPFEMNVANHEIEPVASISTAVHEFKPPKMKTQKVAVIGMSCKLPQSPDLETFWENLCSGKDLIQDTPTDRWGKEQFYSLEKEITKSYTTKGGFLENPGEFDAKYFGIKPNDAIAMDPQQRLALELARELLAHAGYRKEELSGSKTGVYIGAKDNSYIKSNYHLLPEGTHQNAIVNMISNMIAARISDFYDLKGPSQAIDTACSSSLVAVHEAVNAIINGSIDYAIAGGVYIMIDPFGHIGFSQAEVLSTDGTSYVFDKRANGFVLGEGAALVMLKDYESALRDGDQIFGVISGSAVNNDGHTMGLTVPNKEGQKAVIKEALEKAEANPEEIGYYEAHGTGTLLGDPIEVRAATEVYSDSTDKKQFCAIGAVKSNLGHGMTAAGVTGLVKVLLQLHKGKLVPTLHCEYPHPRFRFANSPFYPNTQLKNWNQDERVAAISSFGFGGTNCHLIVENGVSDSVKRKPLPVKHQERANYWIGKPIAVRENGQRQQKKETVRESVSAEKMVEQPIFASTKNSALIVLKEALQTVYSDDIDGVSISQNFMDLGLDSMQLIALVNQLEDSLDIELYPTLFFEYQNLDELSKYLSDTYPDKFAKQMIEEEIVINTVEEIKVEQEDLIPQEIPQSNISPLKFAVGTPIMDKGAKLEQDPIVVVGMQGLFPGAKDINAFWELLLHQVDPIKEIPKDHFDYEPWYDAEPGKDDKLYCKWGAFLDEVDAFDADFFQISPREAEVMDPQLRLLLQVLYATAEDAACIKEIRGSNTGLYVGVCNDGYTREMSENGLKVDPYAGTGNAATMIANRPSFYFDLRGPSMAINTACSSSLIALHTACKGIQNGDCDQAFVAGVNLLLSSWHYRYFSSIGALSKTGRCHSFDEKADGYVPGEAVVSVLLKPLSKALQNGDRIYGVIKGGAVGHGGYTPSITAPSVGGEAEVLSKAWKDAGIDPQSLGYIETHGTGTKLGDPVEINALKKAFGNTAEKGNSIAIGSAKAHIGHTEGAAGLVGVVKALLSIRHKTIPAMPKFETLNPYIQLENSPFFINRASAKWENESGVPLRAGVSSFGFGGAYAHIVVEEYKEALQTASFNSDSALITLSAKSEHSLKQQTQKLRGFLDKNPSLSIHDIAHTLQSGREEMEERFACVVRNIDELKDILQQYISEKETGTYFSGNAKESRTNQLLMGKAGRAFLETAFREKEWDAIAQLWVKGTQINWELFYGSDKPQKLSLPTYAFQKDRYWLDFNGKSRANSVHISPDLLPKNGNDVRKVSLTNGGNGKSIKDQTIDYLKGIVEELSKISANRLDIHTPLQNYGLDSILIGQLTQKLKVEIPDVNSMLFFQYPNLNDMADYFVENRRDGLNRLLKIGKKQMNGSHSEVLVLEKPEPVSIQTDKFYDRRETTCLKAIDNSKARILAFLPFGFGNESLRWMKDLPEDIEVWAVGTEMLNDWKILIETLANDIQHLFDKPVMMWGHSLGGIIAFEVLHLLETRYGLEAQRLVISASSPPEMFERLKFSTPFYEIDENTPEDICRNLLEQSHYLLPEQSGIPQLSGAGLMNDIALCKNYIAPKDKAIKTPLYITQANNDILLKDASVMYAWQSYAKGKVQYVEMEGTHLFFVRPPRGFKELFQKASLNVESTKDTLKPGLYTLNQFISGTPDLHQFPMGHEPNGYLIYHESGYMAAHLWHTQRDETFESNNSVEAYLTYLAYTGSYTQESGIVKHRIVTSLNAQLEDKLLVRYTENHGEQLELFTSPLILEDSNEYCQTNFQHLSWSVLPTSEAKETFLSGCWELKELKIQGGEETQAQFKGRCIISEDGFISVIITPSDRNLPFYKNSYLASDEEIKASLEGCISFLGRITKQTSTNVEMDMLVKQTWFEAGLGKVRFELGDRGLGMYWEEGGTQVFANWEKLG